MVVPTVRGPTDPEFPDPPPKGTDSGPASFVVTDKGPLAAVTSDLTGKSTGSATRGTSSGSTSSSLDILAPLIALERVKSVIIADYENGVNSRYFFIAQLNGGANAQSQIFYQTIRNNETAKNMTTHITLNCKTIK